MLYRPTHPPSYGHTELIHVIKRCGLGSGLKLCLDAGDVNSYSGSGQTWSDVSGQAFHFYRGATSSAEGSDPTFNGVAGRRSSLEYWSCDGGDFFRYYSANATWMNNLHKDNAKFTAAFWLYVADVPGGSEGNLFGTCNAAVVNGVKLLLDSAQTPVFVVYSSTALVYVAAAAAVSIGAWHFIAFSLDESVGTNGAFFLVDQAVSYANSTYTNPSTGNAAYTMEIGASGNAAYPLPNGSYLAEVAMWEGRALTPSELAMLYFKTKGRFGL